MGSGDCTIREGCDRTWTIKMRRVCLTLAKIAIGVVDATVQFTKPTIGGDQKGGWVLTSNMTAMNAGRSRVFGRSFGTGDVVST